MSDPKSLDLGDWALTILAGILVGIVSGLSTAMAWFKGSKARIYLRLEAMEENMKESEKTQAAHDTQLAVLQTCQANISATLVKLERESEKQNDKLDQLLLEARGR